MENTKPRLIVVTGPTASGKTACAIALARKLQTEIISADSMQIYRGMDILTAKPTSAEMGGIIHHLIGFADTTTKFSAAMYRECAMPIIEDMLQRKKSPILCGGTGLYIDAVTRPMGFAAGSDESLRAELTAAAETPSGKLHLHHVLAQIDPEAAQKLHPNDVRRIIRAIEIYRLTGKTQTEQAEIDSLREDLFDTRMFALSWPREILYARIDHRVDEMISMGLIDEVAALMNDEANYPTARQAIGYKEIVKALHGEMRMCSAIDALKQATRNYAKRQLTWFRRDPRVSWIQALDKSAENIAQEILEALND